MTEKYRLSEEDKLAFTNRAIYSHLWDELYAVDRFIPMNTQVTIALPMMLKASNYLGIDGEEERRLMEVGLRFLESIVEENIGLTS